ncbi:MAG: pyruvate formate lyase family protein [Proteobacteria bacterium]|nr:pyruvate formate lyase family protein [Pseudomonadota bacterium]
MNRIEKEAIPSEKQAGTRGQKLWERMLEYRQKTRLSLSRAKLVTASYKETEGHTPPLRRAKACAKIVTNIPIYLEEVRSTDQMVTAIQKNR